MLGPFIIKTGLITLLSIAVITALLYGLSRWMGNADFRWTNATLSIPGLGGSITIKNSGATRHIAHRIYVDLMARKITQPFEENHDLLHNLYQSQYQAFQDIRQELKNIPGEYLYHHNGTAELTRLTLDLLNHGLRPHLTQYATHYNEWKAQHWEDSAYVDLPAVERQRQYPDYADLVDNLQATQELMDTFAKQLYDEVIKK